MAQTGRCEKGQLAIQLTNFLCTKKQGQGLRVVQDFRELNNHSHIDKFNYIPLQPSDSPIHNPHSNNDSQMDVDPATPPRPPRDDLNLAQVVPLGQVGTETPRGVLVGQVGVCD